MAGSFGVFINEGNKKVSHLNIRGHREVKLVEILSELWNASETSVETRTFGSSNGN
jgi:hypothetical protein